MTPLAFGLILVAVVASSVVWASMWTIRMNKVDVHYHELYHIRNSIFNRIAQGELSFNEDSVECTVKLIHGLIYVSKHWEITDILLALARVRPEQDPPAFFRDRRLNGAVEEALVSFGRCIMERHTLVKMSAVLIRFVLAVGSQLRSRQDRGRATANVEAGVNAGFYWKHLCATRLACYVFNVVSPIVSTDLPIRLVGSGAA